VSVPFQGSSIVSNTNSGGSLTPLNDVKIVRRALIKTSLFSLLVSESFQPDNHKGNPEESIPTNTDELRGFPDKYLRTKFLDSFIYLTRNTKPRFSSLRMKEKLLLTWVSNKT